MKHVLVTFCLLSLCFITKANSEDKIQEKDPTKALFDAIEDSDLGLIKDAIEDGAELNDIYYYPKDKNHKHFAYWKPIHMAAYYGKAPIVKFLVSKGAKVNEKRNNTEDEYANFEGYTPIHFTAYHESNDQKEILDFFISKGLSINEEGQYNWTPLNAAIISDYCSAEGIQNLIDRGADVNPPIGKGMSPLCWAINYDANEKFKVIMNNGGDINAEVTYAGGRGDGSSYILDVALYDNNNYIARLLIEKGADIKSRTSYGYSHLHWCAKSNNKSMAYYFMQKGMSPNEEAENGRSPMSIAKEDPEKNKALIKLFETGYMPKAEQEFYELIETEAYQKIAPQGDKKGANFKAKNIRGGSITLEDYKGKVLFLNIWGTWCPPCVREMPSMQKLYEHMKGKDFAMLASSYEKNFDKIKGFIDDKGFTFDVVQDEDQSLVTAYPSVMPTSYIIDKKGNILAKVDGSVDWSEEKYIKLFELLVKMD
jgi:ankyrin repeat protein/peroxiredoxin